MNVLVWLAGGAAAGWITCSFLQLDVARGLTVATIIGIVGVAFGGNALAPAFTGVGDAGVLNPFAVLVVSVGAIASLKIAALIYKPTSIFRIKAITQRITCKRPGRAS